MSNDSRLLRADRAVTLQNVIRFVSANGDVPLSYEFSTKAFAYDISTDGALFTYPLSDTSGNSVLRVAQVPKL